MKFVVSRTDLVALIGKIQNVVPLKPSIPILANFLLEAKENSLTLNATDLSLSIRATMSTPIEVPGAITLPARHFFQLIRELTTPTITLEMQPQSSTVVIQAGGSQFNIQGIAPSAFPTFPDISQGTQFTLNCETLKELLSRSSFSVARDDSRPLLGAIHLQSQGDTLSFLSTDGKRLSRIHTQLPTPLDQTFSSIIPLKFVEEMIRLLDVKESSATLFVFPDKLALEFGSILLIGKLLSGQYPDVSRIIPAKNPAPLSLHREELLSLLRQVSLFTSPERNSVRFTFTPGELQLSAGTGKIGDATVRMPVNYSGDKLEIAFNPIYFLDVLRHTKDDTVHFSIEDSHNPGLITDSSTAQFVIMPMRLDHDSQ